MGSKVAVLAVLRSVVQPFASQIPVAISQASEALSGDSGIPDQGPGAFWKKKRTQTATFQVNLTSVGCYVRLASLICN